MCRNLITKDDSRGLVALAVRLCLAQCAVLLPSVPALGSQLLSVYLPPWFFLVSLIMEHLQWGWPSGWTA